MTKQNRRKGLPEASRDFAESAAKIHQQVRGKENPEVGKKQEKGLAGMAADLRDKAEELRHAEYAKAELIPMF
jgi:hypothetical protein